MSVLIKGMEMPDKCGHCRFATAFDCDVDGQFIPTHDARRKDCPLIHVPDHGRLLDEDAIKAQAEPVKDHTGRVEEIVQMRYLNCIPTIIPADNAPRPDDPRPIDGHREIRGTLDVQTGVLTVIPAEEGE